MKKAAFLLLLWLSGCSFSGAALAWGTPNARYVSTVGSDTYDGTARVHGSRKVGPWRTIQHAVNTLTPGQTGIVLDGTYNETVIIPPTNNGTAGNPITLVGDTLDGAKTLNFQIQANYWVIDGFDISNQTAGMAWPDGVGVWFETGASHNIVQNNYVHELCQEGIYVPTSNITATSNSILNNRVYHAEMSGIQIAGTNSLVQGNEIWGTVARPSLLGGIYSGCTTRSGEDADYIRFFGQGHEIKGNREHDIDGNATGNSNAHPDCFQTWDNGGGSTAANVTIEQNVCTYPAQWNGAGGNHMASIEDWTGLLTFKNNIFVNGNQGLILDYNGVTNAVFKPLHFYNNTLDDVQDGIDMFCPGGGTCTQTDTQIVNNIFYEVGGASNVSYLSNAFDNNETLTNNVFQMRVGSVGTLVAGGYTGIPPYINSDPGFVNIGTLSGSQVLTTGSVTGPVNCDHSTNANCADYHLSSSSTIKTSGTNLAAVTNDYDGKTRPNPPSPGAYQF
jgi:hypothetical protein